MNGHTPADSTRLFKSALAAAAKTATAPLAAPDVPLLVRVGLPTTNQRGRYGEIIAVTRVVARQEVAAMGPRRPRELFMTCTVIVSVYRAGSDDEANGVDLEEQVALRAGELLDAIEENVRLTDTTLGGVVRECFCTSVEIDEPDEQLNSGRSAYAIGEFTARARIT